MHLDDFLRDKLKVLQKASWQRKTTSYQATTNINTKLIQGRKVLQFCSNDYLGLSQDQRLVESAYKAAKAYGVGSTGSRLITGTTQLHSDTERELAVFKNKEAAMLFSSGYMANLGTISALMNQRDIIFADAHNHSSLRAGAELSRAKLIIYDHLNPAHLRELLELHRHSYANALILGEVVYSMDGDVVDVDRIGLLAEEFDCWVMFDEAHSTGVYGSRGEGLLAEQKNCIVMSTCSKALGVEGAFVAGSRLLIDFLQTRANTFIYSTSPSPAIIGALSESLQIIETETWRQKKLWQNVKIIREFLQNKSIPVLSGSSQIICIDIGDDSEALTYSRDLLDRGIWIQAIRRPTVNKARLRLTVNALHTDLQIDQLCESISAVLC